jgi:hypothetical protein
MEEFIVDYEILTESDITSRYTEKLCRVFPRLRKFLARNFLQMYLEMISDSVRIFI